MHTCTQLDSVESPTSAGSATRPTVGTAMGVAVRRRLRLMPEDACDLRWLWRVCTVSPRPVPL